MEESKEVLTINSEEEVIARVEQMEQYMDGVLSEDMLYNLLCDVNFNRDKKDFDR